jgi:hypothetical protein
MNKRSSLIPFITGVVLGVLAAVYLPGYVRPYLPDWLLGKQTIVAGTVTAKQRKEGVLLLTVSTEQGAVLATITRKVDEVDLLVGVGNTLEFSLKTYSPFIEDPRIARVLRAGQTLPVEPNAAVSAPASTGPPPGEKRSREERTQRPGTPGSGAPAEKSAPGAKPPAAK